MLKIVCIIIIQNNDDKIIICKIKDEIILFIYKKLNIY